MNQLNKSNSLEGNLRDTKHNKKAKEVFLKLLAKQKMCRNPFDEVRTQTWHPSNEIKPGPDYA